MRVGIETTTLRGPLAGIGHYVHRVIEALLPLLEQGESLHGFDGVASRSIDAAYVEAVSARDAAGGRNGRGGPWRAAFAGRHDLVRRASRALKAARFRYVRRGFDLFHATNMVPPGSFDRPVLPVVYDLSPLRFPETHPRERVDWLARSLPGVSAAPVIQTISEFSRGEIQALLGVARDRIQVVYPGLAPHFTAPARAADRRFLDALGLTPRGYVLLVATREPRKNFVSAARAYAALPEALRARMPLIWAGQPGWGDAGLPAPVAQAIARGDIRLIGHVPDAALAALYRHTRLFLMPSLYEGFGMPVAEAIACGAPLAVSRIPVFEEVAGRFARYVEPNDIEGWRTAMRDAAEEGHADRDLAARALWTARYSWQTNAASTLGLYRQLAAGSELGG